MKYSFNPNTPIHLQVWLATDYYKKSKSPTEISATALLKPLKSSILSARVQKEIDQAFETGNFSLLKTLAKPKLLSFVRSRLGTALHDSVEKAWLTNYEGALRDLGYSQKFIDKLIINPENEQALPEGSILVYTEKRLTRKFGQYTITGELDFVFNHVIQDLKTTSTYAIKFADDAKHSKQMSIYKWIFKGNGITLKDVAQINYLLIDWTPGQAQANPSYPQEPVLSVQTPLQSDQEVESFIANRIKMVEECADLSEDFLPECTPEDLWQETATWAYYAKPENVNVGRATKVFTDHLEAVAHYNSKGTGILVERPGKIKFCNYCGGFDICKQKDAYVATGLLTLDA